jgi:hypothetical protein
MSVERLFQVRQDGAALQAQRPHHRQHPLDEPQAPRALAPEPSRAVSPLVTAQVVEAAHESLIIGTALRPARCTARRRRPANPG